MEQEKFEEREEFVTSAQSDGEHKYYNVFDAINENGDDENFVPVVTDEFYPTDAQAGTWSKVEVLAERVRKGLPLWHPEDKTTISYRGLFDGLNRARD